MVYQLTFKKGLFFLERVSFKNYKEVNNKEVNNNLLKEEFADLEYLVFERTKENEKLSVLLQEKYTTILAQNLIITSLIEMLNLDENTKKCLTGGLE